jgi:hypothetical protein
MRFSFENMFTLGMELQRGLLASREATAPYCDTSNKG